MIKNSPPARSHEHTEHENKIMKIKIHKPLDFFWGRQYTYPRLRGEMIIHTYFRAWARHVGEKSDLSWVLSIFKGGIYGETCIGGIVGRWFVGV